MKHVPVVPLKLLGVGYDDARGDLPQHLREVMSHDRIRQIPSALVRSVQVPHILPDIALAETEFRSERAKNVASAAFQMIQGVGENALNLPQDDIWVLCWDQRRAHSGLPEVC